MAQRGIAFGFIQNPVVPPILAGNLFYRLPTIGFIPKQAALIFTHQIFKHRAIVRRCRGEARPCGSACCQYPPPHGLYSQNNTARLFLVESASVSICREGFLASSSRRSFDRVRVEEGRMVASTMVPFLTINPLVSSCSLIKSKIRSSRL